MCTDYLPVFCGRSMRFKYRIIGKTVVRCVAPIPPLFHATESEAHVAQAFTEMVHHPTAKQRINHRQCFVRSCFLNSDNNMLHLEMQEVVSAICVNVIGLVITKYRAG